MQSLIDNLLEEDFSILLDSKEEDRYSGDRYSGELICLESGTEYHFQQVSVSDLCELLDAILITRKYL